MVCFTCMFARLSFLSFFLLDVYFVVSGLLYLKSFGETIVGLLFLIFVWYIMWSANKIRMYVKEKNKVSFFRYYFNYLLTAIDRIINDRRFGSTRFLMIASISLSALGGCIGIGTVFFLNYTNMVLVFTNHDLFIKYVHVFLYVSIYPLLALTFRTLTSGGTITQIRERFLTFFPLKFVQMYLYMFTFLTPVAWIAVTFLSYINAKSTGSVRISTISIQKDSAPYPEGRALK